jgi:HEAT repeat protein
MDDQEFQDLIYDMWYPNEARQKAAWPRYQELDREQRVSHLKQVLKTDMDGLIWRSVLLLFEDDPTAHLPSILPLFDAKASGVRFAVATVFAHGGYDGALPELVKLAKSDPSGRVRYRAIEALGKCGTADTIKVLERLLHSDEDDGDGRPLSDVAQESIDEIKDRFGDA